jgi:hypothetical protein
VERYNIDKGMRCEKSLVLGSSDRGEFGAVDGAGLYRSAEYKLPIPLY